MLALQTTNGQAAPRGRRPKNSIIKGWLIARKPQKLLGGDAVALSPKAASALALVRELEDGVGVIALRLARWLQIL